LIPQSFLQALLARLDIVEVIGRHLPLKKGGVNYFACCPFHGEKSPSFSVSPSKQFYHCFGCSAHGNAIDFVMHHQGLSFVEAVHDLARFVGMDVPNEKNAASGPNLAPFLDLMRRAAEFYQYCLGQAPSAHQYLHARGLSVDVVSRFGIGYAPARWDALKALVETYPNPLLRDAGLTVENDEGRTYDRFRDRIMFPIWDRKGQVIAFGGRLLTQHPTKNSPKYLNSPETLLFEKGRELYGWHLARPAAQRLGSVLVVEGYMDVVSLAQFGIENAVATLGTATTAAHLQFLMRQVREIVFCFDGDKAGRNAALRALHIALDYVTDENTLRFLFLPEGQDPDAFVRQKGAQSLERERTCAPSLLAFFIESLKEGLDLDSPDERARFLHQAQAGVSRIKAPMLRLQLIQTLARITDTPVQALEYLWQNPEKPSAAPAHRAPSTARTSADESASVWAHPPAPVAQTQRQPSPRQRGAPAPQVAMDAHVPSHRKAKGACALLLRLVLQNPAFAGRIPPEWVHLQGPNGAALARLIDAMNVGEIGTQLAGAQLLAMFSGDAHEQALEAAHRDNVNDPFEPEQLETLFHDALLRLQSDLLKQEIDQMLRLRREGKLDEAGQKTLARLLRERQSLANLVGCAEK
jgi:DNA primase